MNEEEIIEKIEFAKRIAESEDEPYKKEVFSCVLSKLLNDLEITQLDAGESKQGNSAKELPQEIIPSNTNLDDSLMKKAIHFKEDSVILIKKITGKSRVDRQFKAILIIAYGFKYGLKKGNQLNSNQISIACKNSGVEMDSIDNAFTRLRTRRLLIKENKGGKYNILTPQGDEEAINLLKEQ